MIKTFLVSGGGDAACFMTPSISSVQLVVVLPADAAGFSSELLVRIPVLWLGLAGNHLGDIIFPSAALGTELSR